MFRLTLEPSSGSNVSTWLKLHLWFGGVVQANVVSLFLHGTLHAHTTSLYMLPRSLGQHRQTINVILVRY